MKTFLKLLLVFAYFGSIQGQTIDSANHYIVQPNDTLIVYGSGFNSNKNQVFVWLNEQKVKLVSLGSDSFTFIVPNHINSGRVVYLDSLNKKSCQSEFRLNIMTKYKDVSELSELVFKTKKLVDLDTFILFGKGSFSVDLDDDGVKEILITDFSKHLNIYSYRNNSLELIKRLKSTHNDGTYLYQVRDINSDGKLDLITIDDYNRKINVWYNHSNQDSLSFEDYNVYNFNVDLMVQKSPEDFIDFDGDGHLDFADRLSTTLQDSSFYLSRFDSVGNLYLKKMNFYGLSSNYNYLISIGNNGDKRTDFVALSNSNWGYINIIKNYSTNDSIHLKIVDSFYYPSAYLPKVMQVDVNKDNKLDLIVLYFDNSKSLMNVLFNVSDTNGVKYKRSSSYFSIKDWNYNFSVLDFNFDSVPDIFSSYNDTFFYIKLKCENDSVEFEKHNIMLVDYRHELVGMHDVNSDNLPDFLFYYQGQYNFKVLYGNPYFLDLKYPVVRCFSESTNQIMKDSFVFTSKGIDSFEISGIQSRQLGAKLYKDSGCTILQNYPIKIYKDSSYKFYFSYKYVSDAMDTVRILGSQLTYLGIIDAQYRAATPKIESLSKYYARPGDTVEIKGKNLFVNLNDIVIRIKNRRCNILNSSTNTNLKFVYPKLTGRSRVLLIDTVKKQIAYSSYEIYPTWNLDSNNNRFSFDSELSKNLNISSELTLPFFSQKFELPSSLQTGHIVYPDNCNFNTNDMELNAIGQVYHYPYLPKSNIQLVRYKFPAPISNQLTYAANWEQVENLLDLNMDGKFDFAKLRDTGTVYFCNDVASSQVTYSGQNKIDFKINGTSYPLYNRIEHYYTDLDLDGNLDLITFSRNNQDTFYFFNYNDDKKVFESVAFHEIPNKNVTKLFCGFVDYDDDGKLDYYLRETTPSGYIKYSLYKNISTRGNIRFSSNRIVVLDSTTSISVQLKSVDLNNDNKKDLLMHVANGQFNVYLRDSMNKLNLIDTFHLSNSDLIYNFEDLNGDNKLEFIGNWAYSYNLVGTDIQVKKINLSGLNFLNASFEDMNGDNQVDISYQTGGTYYNNLNSAKFADTKPIVIEANSYDSAYYKIITLYNSGSYNVHLKNFSFTDSNFNLLDTGYHAIGNNVLIRRYDSIKFYLKFSPINRDYRKFNSVLKIDFQEDMESAFQLVWAYVNEPPMIFNILPKKLAPGDTVLIKGRNFDKKKSTPIVYFADTRAQLIAYDDTTLVVKCPMGVVPGVVTVYDTSSNLSCISNEPLHYYFVGSRGNFNINSFQQHAIRNRKYYYIKDINHDGMPDLLFDSSGTSKYSLYNNSNINNFDFSEINSFPTNRNLVTAVFWKDLDGDGSMDYVSRVQGSGNTYNIGLEGSSFRQLVNKSKFYFSDFRLNDINSDGKMELNFVNQTNKSSFVTTNLKKNLSSIPCQFYEGNLDQFFHTNKVQNSPIETYDFDGDGIKELIFKDSGKIAIAFNKTKDTFVDFYGKIHLLPIQKNNFVVADINLDDKLDVVSYVKSNNNFENILTIFLNQSTKGNLSFTKHVDTVSYNGRLENYYLSDLNGDQTLDFVFYSSNSDTLYMLSNLSNSTQLLFDTMYKFKIAAKPIKFEISDMNGDDKPDLIVETANTLFIYKNTNIKGYLSQTSYSYNQKFGSPFLFNFGIVSNGGDTLVINKIKLPPGFKLYNKGSFNLNSIAYNNGIGVGPEINLPLKVSAGDTLELMLVIDSLKKPGSYNELIEFFNNESKRPYNLYVQGTIDSSPLAYTNHSTMDFGLQKRNIKRVDSFYLKNIGTDTLKISNIECNDTAHFKLKYNSSIQHLLINDSMWFKVEFASGVKDYYNAYIKINHNDVNKENFVYLLGETSGPIIKSNLQVDFESQYVYSTKYDTCYMVNVGNDTLEIKSYLFDSTQNFSLISKGLKEGFVLPKDTLLIFAEFLPTDLKPYASTLAIYHNADNDSTKIEFEGTGIGAKIELLQQHFDLGLLKTNKSYQFNLPFKNKGDQKLKIYSIYNSNSIFNYSNCTSTFDSLSMNDSSNICLLALNGSSGIQKDTFQVWCNGKDTLNQYTLEATFIQAKPKVDFLNVYFNQHVKHLGQSKLVLKNEGNDTLFGVSCYLKNNIQFSVVDSNGFTGELLPGQSTYYLIRFQTDQIGYFNDSLKIGFLNSLVKYSYLIEGNGFSGLPALPKQLQISSKINHLKKQVVYLKNTGNSQLKLRNIHNDLPEFNVYYKDSLLSVNDSIAIDIEFLPNKYQKEYIDTLYVFTSSDTVGYDSKVVLMGTCLYPEFELSIKDTLFFSNTKTNTISIDSFAIVNIGDDTLKVDFGSLTQFDFQTDYSNGVEILPSDSLFVLLKFNPLKQTLYLDSLMMYSNSLDTSNKLIVVGNGAFNPDIKKINVSKNKIDFGKILVGTEKVDTVYIKNTLNDSIKLFVSRVDQPFYNLSKDSFNIPVNDSVSIVVKYKDDSVAYFQDTMYLYDEYNNEIGQVIIIGRTHGTDIQSVASMFLNVYPNPANTDIFVDMKNEHSNVQMELFDLNGKIVCSEYRYLNDLTLSMDVQNVSEGIYLLVISTNDLVYKQKVVVKH